MKKVLLIISILFLCACSSNKDALKFKEDYEQADVNLTENVKVKIAKDNPIKYVSLDEYVKMQKDKESFVIFFGHPKDIWSRIVAPLLVDVANELEIETIYYLDVSNMPEKRYDHYIDEGHNEISYPLIEVIKDGEVESFSTGSSTDKVSDLLDTSKEEIKENIKTVLINSLSTTCGEEPSC